MPQIKLPFWECLRRSFLYVLANLGALAKISSVWFLILIYEAVAGFPSLCSLKEGNCPSEGYQNLSVVIASLASIAIAVGFSRQIILKEPRGYFHFSFGRCELKYLLYSLMLFLLIIIPSIITIGILGGILKAIGIQGSGAMLLLAIIPLMIAITVARCFIILPAIAVDDKDLTMEKAFKLTKGNANKIFWGQALLMLPVIILVTLLSSVYENLGTDNFVADFIMALLLLGLSFFDTALKISFYSHVYQYFIYFWHHQDQLSKD